MGSLIVISIIIYRFFVIGTHLTTIIIGCVTGLIVLLIATLFNVVLIPFKDMNKRIRIKKDYFVIFK